jgi:hypothetical protein
LSSGGTKPKRQKSPKDKDTSPDSPGTPGTPPKKTGGLFGGGIGTALSVAGVASLFTGAGFMSPAIASGISGSLFGWLPEEWQQPACSCCSYCCCLLSSLAIVAGIFMYMKN